MEAAKNISFGESPRATQFGRYRLLESIGQGGMADVMVAVMPGPARFNKLVVIKTIRETVTGDDAQYAQMFLDEARLAARLNHPNVVHTYDVGNEKGVYYIAMEYLEGQALSQVSRRLGVDALPLEARLRILIGTAHGLHHAHELTDYSGRPLHVVHCDVSPHNIFLTYDGQVKLLDFGIAKMRDAEAATVVGQVKGKIDYMAPEQLKGERVDRTADVFALGAIMWEFLAGRPMSGGRELSQITRAHNRLAKQESAIRTVVPELDGELARICDKALAHDKSERYQTALAFAHDLQEYLSQRKFAPTAEQLSQIVQPAFEEVRARRRKRIEASLAAVEREQTELLQAVIATQEDSGARLTTPRIGRNSDTQDLTVSTGGIHQSQTHSTPVSVYVPPRSKMGPRVAFIAAVVGLSAWIQLRSEPEPKSVPVAVAHAESAVQAAAPSGRSAPAEAHVEAKATVKLSIYADTPGIQVLLDGSAIPQLPFEADLAKDNAIHKIIASAAGHETITQVLTLDRDRQVTLTLPVAKAPHPMRGRRVDRPKVAAASPEVAPVAGSSELRPGQEMDRRARGAAEMSDEDPYR